MRLFDLHCDTLYELLKKDENLYTNTCHVDIQRGKVFDRWIQCFALWASDMLTPDEAFARASQMVLKLKTIANDTPAVLGWAGSSSLCEAIVTIENGGAYSADGSVPPFWNDIGVRMVSLTWNGGNVWAQGCYGDTHKGITASGKAAVRTLEQNGIILDAAHLNRRSFWDLAEIHERPFLVSHTAADTVFTDGRNLDDSQFDAVRQVGGIVGLDFCEQHLGARSLDAFICHLEHFLSRGGEQTVALGSDFDGITLPDDWNGLSVLPRLYERLLQRNYAKKLVEDIFFNNAYRFYKNNIQEGIVR